jgi:hypothetical protein
MTLCLYCGKYWNCDKADIYDENKECNDYKDGIDDTKTPQFKEAESEVYQDFRGGC